MITADDFPNLKLPIWDRIRIPARLSAAQIGTEMCRKAGCDVDEVRDCTNQRRLTTPGITQLRQQILMAMAMAKVPETEMLNWFRGMQRATARRHLYEARKMERAMERADA